MAEPKKLRILFSSYHSCFDPSSGATISLRDLFQLLLARGWECRACCGPRLDFEEPRSISQLLKDAKLQYRERKAQAHGMEFVIYNTVIDGVTTALYETPNHPPARDLTQQQGQLHTTIFENVLREFQPDVLLTYGGQIMARSCMALARQRGIKVVFWLQNFGYHHARTFEHIDGAFVPSVFTAEHYKSKLGLECTVIHSPLDWTRVQCDASERRYLTFVNPSLQKGVFVFAAIVRELARQRPDIPVLVVEGRGGLKWIRQTGVDLSGANLVGMKNTRDPRKFYSITRAMLVPSLGNDTYPRVVQESMINGIPVLASTRGGLREVVGKGGFLFDIPSQYTASSRLVPKSDEIKDIVETVIRLWDDESFYAEASSRARQEAERWRPEHLADQYEAYFRKITGAH